MPPFVLRDCPSLFEMHQAKLPYIHRVNFVLDGFIEAAGTEPYTLPAKFTLRDGSSARLAPSPNGLWLGHGFHMLELDLTKLPTGTRDRVLTILFNAHNDQDQNKFWTQE